MLPYLFILLLIVFFTVFDGSRFEKIFFSSLVIVVFIFVGFRFGGTGLADYFAYLRFYNVVNNFDEVLNPTVHAEIGFRLTSYIGNYLGFSSQYIIVVMAFLSIFTVGYVIYRYSDYKILSLLVWLPYILTMNMQSSRISVAAGFGLLFIIFFYKKDYIKSILFFLLAMSFHSSAICLATIFITRLKLNTLFIYVIVSFFIGYLFSPFLIITDMLNSLGLHQIAWMVSSYSTSEDYGYPMKIYDPRILLAFLSVLLLHNIRSSINSSFYQYLVKVYYIGMIFFFFLSKNTIMTWRISYLFLLTGVLVLPFLCKYYNLKYYRVFSGRVMSVFYVFLYLLYSLSLIVIAQSYNFYFFSEGL
ncbi:EpsG family protein [Photobacterium leiognathi]|uniref:EpsG family protein n=1 Tax=Photobacterium leiognathi TaxID=553611 RepID=UPI00298103EA|nr:EpsG family protein [Photobacterium leiognathi]